MKNQGPVLFAELVVVAKKETALKLALNFALVRTAATITVVLVRIVLIEM